MDIAKLIVKGFIIGIGKIIPGVSGAMIAISLDVYEKALYIISHLFTEVFHHIKFVLFLSIGLLLGIVFGSKAIIILLDRYYLPTMLTFIGLISGCIPSIYKKTKAEPHHKIYILSSIIFTIILSIIQANNSNISLGNSHQTFLKLIIIGMIEAFSMIVPGISSTAIMLLIGYYKPLLNIWSNILSPTAIIANRTIIFPFVVGLIIGIILLSKIMTYLFKHHYAKTMAIIVGLSIGSIILLYKQTLIESYQPKDIIIGLILLVASHLITIHLES